MSEALYTRLQALLGPGGVERDAKGLPRAVPESDDALATVCALASEEGWKLRLEGAGTWLSADAPADLSLSTRSLNRLMALNPADLVETLYRGLADNTVGKVIDGLLRHDAILVDELGFAPLDDIGTQLLFRFVAAAYERRSLGVASHWPFDQWGRFLPQQSTATSLLDRLLHHAVIVVTEGESFRMKEARSRAGGHAVRSTTLTTTTRRTPGGPTSTSVA